MSPLKVGWIGCGFVGQAAHLEAFVRNPAATITGLAELRAELRSSALQSYGIHRGFPDHHKLLSELDCDTVVAIVNRRHTFEVARDVLNAGKHLLTEKPMALTHEKAKILVEIAESKALTYSVGFMRRYDQGVIKTRELLQDSDLRAELGNIVGARFFVEAGSDYCGIEPRLTTKEVYPRPLAIDVAPAWLPEALHEDYERFLNICSHDINLINFFFDGHKEVEHVDFHPCGYSTAVLSHDSMPILLQWMYRPRDEGGWKEGLEIKFEMGSISLELPPAFLRNVPSAISIEVYQKSGADLGSIKQILGDYSWSFTNSDKAFVDAVLTGAQTEHSGAKCLKDFLLFDRIWQEIARRYN